MRIAPIPLRRARTHPAARPSDDSRLTRCNYRTWNPQHGFGGSWLEVLAAGYILGTWVNRRRSKALGVWLREGLGVLGGQAFRFFYAALLPQEGRARAQGPVDLLLQLIKRASSTSTYPGCPDRRAQALADTQWQRGPFVPSPRNG